MESIILLGTSFRACNFLEVLGVNGVPGGQELQKLRCMQQQSVELENPLIRTALSSQLKSVNGSNVECE